MSETNCRTVITLPYCIRESCIVKKLDFISVVLTSTERITINSNCLNKVVLNSNMSRLIEMLSGFVICEFPANCCCPGKFSMHLARH